MNFQHPTSNFEHRIIEKISKLILLSCITNAQAFPWSAVTESPLAQTPSAHSDGRSQVLPTQEDYDEWERRNKN